jgi:hypothetical protein
MTLSMKILIMITLSMAILSIKDLLLTLKINVAQY